MCAIFLANDLGPFDGWSRYSRNVCQYVANMLGQIVICAKSTDLVENQSISIIHHRFASLTDRSPKPVLALLDALIILRKVRNVESVHALIEPLVPVGYLLSVVLRKPLFVSAQGTYGVSMLNGHHSWLYKRCLDHAVAIFVPSQYTRMRMIAIYPNIGGKIIVTKLGVDPPLTASIRAVAKDRAREFVFVGEVKPRKGLIYVIEALAKVVSVVPEATLHVVGKTESNSPYGRRVLRRIEKLNLAEHIIWHGVVSDQELAELYDRVRGLVVLGTNDETGPFEGFGLVHLEANRFGVPSVGCTGCGNEDAIEDGASGFLVEQRNVDECADRMLRLIESDDAWDMMSKCAMEHAARMSWQNTACEIATAYHRCGIRIARAGAA